MRTKAKYPRSEFDHAFMNWPNGGTRKCTKCGLIKRITSISGKSMNWYERDGKKLEEYEICPISNKPVNY